VGKKQTAKALQERGFLDSRGELTVSGWEQAVVLLPVEEQCRALKIPMIERRTGSVVKSPEEAVVKMLEQDGKRSYFTENSFGVHIPFFFLYPFSRTWEVLTGNRLYGISPADYRESLHWLHRSLRLLPLTVKPGISRKIYSRIELRMRRDAFFRQDLWPTEFYEEVATSLHPRLIRELTSLALSDYNAYHRGWPDIVVLSGNETKFIEVKTTDTFHLSQVRTIRRLRRLVPCECWRIRGR
jgi:hypothetical protein